MLSLRSPRRPSQTRPSGEHDLDARASARARCRSAAPRCRRRWSTDCRRSCSCPRRRATAGTGARRRRAACCTAASVTPASTVSVALSRVDGAYPVHPRERDHDRVAAGRPASRRRTGRCCRPAERSATPASAHARTTAATSAVLPGRTTAARPAVVAATPVGEIGGDVGGSGEDLRAADGRVEARPQGCANVRHERG